MKTFFASLGMSFAMFSIIPMPRLDWKKENMRYMLCCLPFVGLVIGLVLWLWLLVSRALGFGDVLFAAGLTVLPALISGSVLVEYIFNLPGMGTLSLQSLSSRDYPLQMALFTFAGALTLTGIFICDLLYMAADPRIRLTK